MKNSQLDPLSPLWTGAATAIASLYGLWPAMEWLRGPGQPGEKWFVLMFVGPIMFFAVMLPATAILCIIYKRIEEAIRYTASVVLAGLFLVFPSLLEGLAETLTGLDVPYPAPFGLALAAALLLKQKFVPARLAA